MNKILIPLLCFSAVLASGTSAAVMKIHRQVLETQVRVRTEKAGGSGTVIYSQKTDKFYSTYILTCHHVVEDAIRLETKWDSVVRKDRKKEMLVPVLVELFKWDMVPHGDKPVAAQFNAEIAAYSPDHDIAIVHVLLGEAPPVAKLPSLSQIHAVSVGSEALAVGCALGHDPILTVGHVSHMGDVIDGKDYWMSTAQIIFGNSGGGVFTPFDGDYFYIGIPSRVDVIGWGTAVSHCGYFSPISRIYEFLEEQIFDFLIPGSDRTEAQCAKERKDRRDLEERKIYQ